MPQSSPQQSKGQYINGEWIKGRGTIFESKNPAYGNTIWQGSTATDDEIIMASQAARQALPPWSATSFDERAHITQQFAKLVEQKRNELALIISKETGKPLWESYTEVNSVVGKINISLQAYHERTWPKYTDTPEARACLRFKPHGVVAVLGAFNFPAHLSNGHIIPALLAGNSILYKPSEQAPAVAEFIMECWHQSGIPAGVINCLQGGADVGKTLLSQPINGVYFTGSYHTGLKIHQFFSGKPQVILALEMGGNNPLIIDKIKDLDAAIYMTILSTLMTSGQRCTCARRVIIPNTSKGDEFIKRFLSCCQSLVIAPYDQHPESFMGPVISYDQALNTLDIQDKLTQLGGELLLKSTLIKENTGLISPGVIDMTSVKNAPDQEIFAPFIQIYRSDDFDHAIELANQTQYGLAAGLLSENPDHYQQFYHSIQAGLINWNRPTTGASSNLPFGGVGLSGNHRPSAYFASDYCSYPIASMEHHEIGLPSQILPGISLENN